MANGCEILSMDLSGNRITAGNIRAGIGSPMCTEIGALLITNCSGYRQSPGDGSRTILVFGYGTRMWDGCGYREMLLRRHG